MPKAAVLARHWSPAPQAGPPAMALRRFRRIWRWLEWSVMLLVLMALAGLVLQRMADRPVGILTALLATTAVAVGMRLAWAGWQGMLAAPARRAFARRGRLDLRRWVAGLPSLRDSHEWSGDWPGIMALTRDGLALCCEETGFAPLRIDASGIRTVRCYRVGDAPYLSLICRPTRYGQTLCVAIPFRHRDDAARWRDALHALSNGAAS